MKRLRDNRVVAAAAVLFLSLSLCTMAVAQNGRLASEGFRESQPKRALQKQEILGHLPKGIINQGIIPGDWLDNKSFTYFTREGGVVKRMVYDITTHSAKEASAASAVEATAGKTAGTAAGTAAGAAVEATAECSRILEAEKAGVIRNPLLSPDGKAYAYTKADNNLYLYNIASDKEIQLTNDGTEVIKNGWASWVYYEEILGRPSKYRAFWWSPESNRIAYYKFDDSKVAMFPIYNSEGQYGSITRTHYPKAGDTNPTAKVGFIEVDGSSRPLREVWADFEVDSNQYFGIPFWNAKGDRFIVPWMPRGQDTLILYAVNPLDGSKEQIYTEHQKSWIDWPEQMIFTDEGFYMIRDFEMWEQIYFQSFDGKRLERITSGKNWGIEMLELDSKGGKLYFTARRTATTRRDLYSVELKSKEIKRLTIGDYDYANIKIAPDFKHFVADFSNSTTPTRTGLFTIGKRGTTVYVINDTKGEEFDNYKIALPQMLSLNVDGYTIPAKITLPVDLDTTKSYPVIVFIYGGPNAGTVMDTWTGVNETTQWWANEGVIRVEMDHRASGHCGKEGVNFMYRNFVTIELKDYIAWMKELYKRPYINREKVGITGFSYGGTVTGAAVIRYGEYFPYGIAGGGVYDYALYDTHYTERYMDTPQDNPEGYANTRLMNFVEKYKGDSTNFLRITHGTSDDNVHLQNTLQLVDALEQSNKQFEMTLYPGQFHGYRGLKYWHSRNADYIFWYRHLLGREAPEILLKKRVVR